MRRLNFLRKTTPKVDRQGLPSVEEDMKTPKNSKPLPAVRSVVLCALTTRHTTKMRDRRAPRGGSSNKQSAYKAGDY